MHVICQDICKQLKAFGVVPAFIDLSLDTQMKLNDLRCNYSVLIFKLLVQVLTIKSKVCSVAGPPSSMFRNA